MSVIYNAILDMASGEKYYIGPANLTFMPMVNNKISEVMC